MFDWSVYLSALVPMLALVFVTWVLSVVKRNVAIVDSIWGPLFLVAALTFAYTAPHWDAPGSTMLAPHAEDRRWLVLVLVAVWALRLAGYITWRNWGHEEDRRYQAIRARNEPGFTWKSLYLVFVFQALLAWVVALPLLGAMLGPVPLGWLDYAGVALWALGVFFETVGDAQLARFKADPANRGRVMDRGLWRHTRHPNYFGDFCVWWGFYLIALSAGAWWSLIGPLIMTALLMKYSGAGLLEKDISQRRPEYAEYIRRTSGFFPRPPRD